MRNYVVVVIGLLTMTACAESIEPTQSPIIGPDGKYWHIATCYDNHGDCLIVMGNYCLSKGYEISDYGKDTQSEGRGYAGAWRSSTTSTETIMFRCKENE